MDKIFGFQFNKEQTGLKSLRWGDWFTLGLIVAFLAIGVHLAVAAPPAIYRQEISLEPVVLPWYALFSVVRMAGAYLLSILFTLFYGRAAAYNSRAEKILMPLLDVLQSVPILSFLPVVLLGLAAILPANMAAELASVVLIFTSQAWNLTFAWYQSLTTIPKELREASSIFRLGNWYQFKNLEMPFALISLIWNSMMSWAGGWFFLMAAESFTVGQKDFRLLGLGSYLHEASQQGNLQAVVWGLVVLVFVIVLLDQLVWRPLIAWSDRFKVEMVENDNPPTSWFYDIIKNSALSNWFFEKITAPVIERIDLTIAKNENHPAAFQTAAHHKRWWNAVFMVLAGSVLIFGLFQAVQYLNQLSLIQWQDIAIGVLATALRVFAALLIAIIWTIPVGVAIGSNPKISALFQPLVQVIASIPATALFPIMLMFILASPGGLNIAAVILMLLGTQWYLLFNIIAGANAIPQDLKFTANLMQLSTWQRWKTLTLPALFPYLITGAITASGGAWNASIVAEYVTFNNQTYSTTGIGALIAQATADGNYAMLLAATLSMIITVVILNRLVWRPLYRTAEETYRME